MHKFNTNSQ